MEINFDAQLRLTEALLPLLRASAPSAIVNVASTAGRVSRSRTGAYSASKAALAGWSDALRGEEGAERRARRARAAPGFISTEGFPQSRSSRPSRGRAGWSRRPRSGAEAIRHAGLGGESERYVPRGYAVFAALRVVAPGLVRRILDGPRAQVMTTTTGPDRAG